MKYRIALKSLTMIVAMILFCKQAGAVLFINEVDYDQTGSDTAEFVELAGSSGSYSGYSLQLINGSGG